MSELLTADLDKPAAKRLDKTVVSALRNVAKVASKARRWFPCLSRLISAAYRQYRADRCLSFGSDLAVS